MPSKRTPVSLELTSVRSNKCGVFCACFGKLCVSVWTHDCAPMISTPVSLDVHTRVCPATGFCSTSTATRLSATNVPHFLLQQSLFSPASPLSTNKSGHFQTSWLLFARLYNYSHTNLCREHNTTIWIRSKRPLMLSHNIYWSNHGCHALPPPRW